MDLSRLDKQIVESATWLLKYYLRQKYQFRNVAFWGEFSYQQWDEKIAELRKIISTYR